MDINIESLEYLLSFTEDEIEHLIYNVLENSKDDPHYSAVTANNMLVCYMEIMTSLGKELPYSNMESFFEYLLLSEEEYDNYKQQYDDEKIIYVGRFFPL